MSEESACRNQPRYCVLNSQINAMFQIFRLLFLTPALLITFYVFSGITFNLVVLLSINLQDMSSLLTLGLRNMLLRTVSSILGLFWRVPHSATIISSSPSCFERCSINAPLEVNPKQEESRWTGETLRLPQIQPSRHNSPRPFVAKVCCTDRKGFATSSQRLRGYVSVRTALKYTYF
jgi:hypothetical protein